VPEIRDVLIVGAGPAGSALAYFLARQGIDVLLLDKAEFPRDKTCGDGLTPRALRMLRVIGLLDKVIISGFRINGAVIYAPNGEQISSSVPACGDLPQFLVVLPRYQLDNLIREHAVAAGAEFRPQVNVTNVLRAPMSDSIVGVRAYGPNGLVELRARYTVLATGASVGLLDRAHLLQASPRFARATRVYYEGMQQLSDHLEFHFDSVPLPGYGWIFPVSPTAANVGVCCFAEAVRIPSRRAFDDFTASPRVAQRLKMAERHGPVKGYPMRIDFPTAQLDFPGLLLLGEAAGLVNPLTGEGIDYALESAEVGAESLVHAFRTGESLKQTGHSFSQALRDRFLRTFIIFSRLRDIYVRPWLLNRMVAAAARHEAAQRTFIQVCLGSADPAQALSLKMLFKFALG